MLSRLRTSLPPDTLPLFAAATALNFAGVLARWVVSPEMLGLAASLGIYLLPPLLVVVGFCTQQPRKNVRWGAALAAAALAGWHMFAVSDPSVNEDANFGIGFYLMFGIFPLTFAALLGGIVGRAYDAVRGTPTPAHQGIPTPRPPVVPWLWPALLLLPAALLAGWLEWMDMQATLQEIGMFTFGTFWSEVPMFVLFNLLMLFPFMLLPLLWLRHQAKREWPRAALSAWWGVCVGLALTLLLPQFWPELGMLGALTPLQFLPAAALGTLGWYVGRAQK